MSSSTKKIYSDLLYFETGFLQFKQLCRLQNANKSLTQPNYTYSHHDIVYRSNNKNHSFVSKYND